MKATKEQVLDFIKEPLITTNADGSQTTKYYSYEEGKFILENYILPYKSIK